MLSLTEFKQKAIAEEKQYYKELISEGKELPECLLAEEAEQEYFIESSSLLIIKRIKYNIPKGLYILKVTGKSKIVSKKIIFY